MRVGIVGAGISGLTVALELIKKGIDVVVYEEYEPGGLAGGIPFLPMPDTYLDIFYHHFFTTDAYLIQLLNEYGFAGDILWQESVSGIYTQQKSWLFDTPLHLLQFKPLGSLWQRFLMGLNFFYFKQTTNWHHLDTIRCKDFFESRFNKEGYENFWKYMLQNKFADAYENISAAFLWGRIHPRTRSRKKGKEVLGYLKGGFQRLINAMSMRIKEKGGKIYTRTKAHRVIEETRPRIVSSQGEEEFDRVVWTANLDSLSHALHGAKPDIINRLKNISYMAVTGVILVMNKQQSNFYWLNCIDPLIRFGIVVEHTNFIPEKLYAGKHIIYVITYHTPADSMHQLPDADIASSVMASLKNIYPGFKKEDVEQYIVTRNQYSSPVYTINFCSCVPPFRGWLTSVDICGMGQEYPDDRNMNSFVRNAMRYVKEHYS